MEFRQDDNQEEQELEEKPSRTQKKRASEAIHKFAVDLAKLNLKQLARVELPTEIFEQYEHASRINSFPAKKRQLKYIGSLIRRDGGYPAYLEKYLVVKKQG